MSKKSLETEVENLLKNEGCRLIGTAGVLPLPNVPEMYLPQTILKEAKSVICYGVPIPKGIIYAERDAPLLYWRYWSITYKSLDAMAHKLCFLLEENGYRAVPPYA